MSVSLSRCLAFFSRWSDLCCVHQSARHCKRMMGVALHRSFSSSLTLRTKHIYYLKSALACLRQDRGNDIVPFWEMKWWLPRYDMMSICRFRRQPTNNCSLFISVSLSLSQQHYSAKRCLEWDGPWRVWFCAVTIKLFKRFKPHSSLPNPTSHYSAWNNGVVQIWCENNEIEVKVYWH